MPVIRTMPYTLCFFSCTISEFLANQVPFAEMYLHLFCAMNDEWLDEYAPQLCPLTPSRSTICQPERPWDCCPAALHTFASGHFTPSSSSTPKLARRPRNQHSGC